MKRKNKNIKAAYWVAVCVFLLTGCAADHSAEEETVLENHSAEEETVMENEKEEPGEEKTEEPETESGSVSAESDTEDFADGIVTEPEIADADWSEYFGGLNGTAVIYNVSDRRYIIYNGDLAETRRSPCSTFKIISSLIALENGITTPEDSTRKWSGEVFWNEDWNKDIDFNEAFRTSCVWYYRQVMLVPEQGQTDISIYGKTGMGKAEGVVVDAWFTGFAEGAEGRLYFCVRLGRTDGMNVSSTLAKEIAIQIVSDYYDW